MGKQKKGQAAMAKPPSGFALAAKWPLHEVMLSQGWNKPAALASILVARRSIMTNKVAAGLLLVDLACLGVKSAQAKLFAGPAEYNAGLRQHALHVQPMQPADFDLVAKIVDTAVGYAAGLGFRPDPVFAQVQHLLAGANPAACTTPVPTGGPEGKPFFVSGPYDDVPRIIGQLTRAVGEGNFNYMLGAGDLDPE
ncbi:MAG TPA: hypothetical protein PKK15_22510 [Kouleothrix sp.]|uniref:hypothetical protein n=1 Tax=Kouleothrix sp. TaxID=2779161 RepID=UPI002CD015FE|nr:hypothetical protein [Kouleothrix sp.]